MVNESNQSKHETKMFAHARKGTTAFERYDNGSYISLAAVFYHAAMAKYHEKMGHITLEEGGPNYA